MKKYNKYIVTGIMSIIPIAITYWIIENLFIFFSKPGKFLIDQLYSIKLFDNFDFVLKFYDILAYLTGFLLTILFLYILGLIVSNVIGKKVYVFFENFLTKIPIVNKIYITIKQITNTFSKPNNFLKSILDFLALKISILKENISSFNISPLLNTTSFLFISNFCISVSIM